MDDLYFGQLSTLPIFDGVEKELTRTLLSQFSSQQYRAGATIIDEGEKIDRLYIVQLGIVDLTRVDGEHECGVLLLSAKDVLMPAAAIFEESSLVTVRALTTTKLAGVSAEVIRSAALQSSHLARNIMKVMSGQWRMAVRNILDLNCRTAAQRLGAFLLHLADLQEDGAPILPIAKRHLASRLGVAPETLSRTLHIVAANGLHLRGRAIIIHDRARIERFCGPDPYLDSDERRLSVYAF